jgi:hypothetical protein
MRQGALVRSGLVSALVLVATLAGAAAASAGTFYVTPTGDGSGASPCTQQAPCSFDYAVKNKGNPGDEISIAQGQYASAGGLTSKPGVIIHGPAGGTASVSIPTNGMAGSLSLGAGGELDNLTLSLTGPIGLNYQGGGKANRLAVLAAIAPYACQIGDTAASIPSKTFTMTNSLCLAPSGVGFVGTTNTSVGWSIELRNDTFVGQTDKQGLLFNSNTDANVLSIVNTIVYRRVTGATSCSMQLNGPSAGAFTVHLKSSDYQLNQAACTTHNPSIDATGSASSSPSFANDVADPNQADYREVAGSPTIDAGLNDGQSGSIDLGGLPRVGRTGIDIGAFQFFPAPIVTPGAPTGLTATSVMLHATVDGLGRDTSNSFSYGLTTQYDQAPDAINLPQAAGPQPVSLTLTGLTPLTTYHYQLCSLGSTVTCDGDATFTTLPLAPRVTGGSASTISRTDATLHATVNPSGASTAVQFLYGTSVARESASGAVTLPASGTDSPVAIELPHLLPGTVYHAHAVATNPGGTTTGPDFTFKTVPASNAFRLRRHTVSKSGVISLQLTAPGAGRFSAAASKGRLSYGKASATARKAGNLALTIKPSRRVHKQLLARRAFAVVVKLTFSPVGGPPKTTKLTLRLRLTR